MLTRQEVLLLVGAMHFVAVVAAIHQKVAPNMRIIKNFDVCGTIHQTPMYLLLESVLGTKGAEVRQSMANVTLNLCPGQFWPPSSLVRHGKLLRIRFWHHKLEKHGCTFGARTD